FCRIADVDGAVATVALVHHTHDGLDHVVDVAERARLASVAIHRDRPVAQRLTNEIDHHAPIVQAHAGSVGIEDPRDTHAHREARAVDVTKRFGAALALVVTGTRTHGVDVPPVVLVLRMHAGMPVDL